ncbi:hypothetical protein [Rahnella bruchi]|nr:hypothetical protein [Rahnella bruchi]
MGYRDGNQLPVEEYVARAASIFRVISVPDPGCRKRYGRTTLS